MWKVVALASLSALAWSLSRGWRPTHLPAAVAVSGLRGALLGTSVSALIALVLLAMTANPQHKPFHLSIYLIACFMLVTPATTAWGVVARLRRPPDPQEKPSFQGMLDDITQDRTAPPEESS